MTMALICTHGAGPNVARCRPDGHLEHTKAPPGKGRSECPHRDADGRRCGNRSAVLSEKQLAELLGLDLPGPGSGADSGGLGQRWAAEGPPGSWRDMLAEPSGGPVCGNPECGCDNPPERYTGAHTATICPGCDPECWEISDSARGRARQLEETAARKAAREGTASPQLPQPEIDRQDRERRQLRSLLLAAVSKVLADPHLTGQCRSDFEWFAERLPPGVSAERLAELEEQIREQPVQRHGWWRRSFGAGEIRDYLLWATDGTEDEDQADDDGDGQDEDAEVIAMPGPGGRLAIEQAPRITGSVLCEPCLVRGSQSLAVARVRSNVPSMIPEQDVCPGHFREHAAIIERMSFGELIIFKQYGSAPGVRSIRPGTGPARTAEEAG